MLHLSDTKRFNLFIFFTMVAKFSVDLFLPVILYKLNYSIKSILIFLLLTYIINIISSIIATKIGKKRGYKFLILASAFIFLLFYLVVSRMKKNIFVFLIVALLSSLCNTLYYISRHNYASIVLEKSKSGKSVGQMIIATVMASMVTSILSAIILDKIPMFVIAIITTGIYLLGTMFIFFIKLPNKNPVCSLKKVYKKITLKTQLFFGFQQFKTIFFTLYPLFVYIFVENTYTYIGLIYLVAGLASIIFVYFFSLKIDQGNFNHIKRSITLLSIILFIDLYISNRLMALIVVFFENIFIKLYETSVTNCMYNIRGNIDNNSYFLYMEILFNVSRIIIVLLLLILSINIRVSLFLCIFCILISGFIKIDASN